MSLIGGIFAMFTVGMFIFYMVAQGPRFKRAVLAFFPRQRQEELVSIWEAAIDKTGGYFYSKLLLAVINGGLFFVVLLALGVPGAAALATFQGVVAEFIPIVGTYIAAIVPLVIALVSVGMPETLILLDHVLIYQQVENYLSPHACRPARCSSIQRSLSAPPSPAARSVACSGRSSRSPSRRRSRPRPLCTSSTTRCWRSS
jgi:predicted PurR-regulated permease PerM